MTGKVQGVFFRVSAKEKAGELGLAGTARNERGGSVLIVIEGEEKMLQKFVLWCEDGSELAEVSSVVIEQKSAPEGLSGFVVL